MNTYGYVGGNPIALFDSLGLRPLTDCEKRILEPYFFKEDLDNANIHEGGFVPLFLKKGMKAVTNHDDIYFKNGVYEPYTAKGMALLAHELMHVEWYRQGNLSIPGYIKEHKVNPDHSKNKYEIPAIDLQLRLEMYFSQHPESVACACLK